MALREAVRFRRLISILDDKEKSSFLSELITRTPDLIVSALFNHFNTISENVESKATKHTLNIDLNARISEIINARSSENAENEEESKPCTLLSTMPPPILSKIASYLLQYEYGRFCQVSSDIFIGCQSPNSLQQICLTYEGNNNHPFDCSLYSSANELIFDLVLSEIRMKDFMHSSFADQLQKITFSGFYQDEWHEDWHHEFSKFPICHNAQKLQLENWGGSTVKDIPDDFFCEFLSKFPNIECLELSDVDGTRIDCDNIKALYPHLKGLSIAGSDYGLIRFYAEDLEFLQIDGDKDIEDHIDQIKLCRLQQIQLRNVHVATLHNTISGTRRLRKIHLSCLWMESEHLKDFEQNIISEMIIMNASIEYIGIRENGASLVVNVLKGIINGFKKTKNRHRIGIKIELMPRHSQAFIHEPLLVPVVRDLAHLMKSMNCDDFMLIWRGGEISSLLEMDCVKSTGKWIKNTTAIIRKFRVGDNVKIIDLKSRNHWNGVIGNIAGRYSATKQRWPVEIDNDDGKRTVLLKESNLIRWNNNNELDDKYACNINGYSEQWMMECCHR